MTCDPLSSQTYETITLNTRRLGQRRMLTGEFMRATAKERLEPTLGFMHDEMIYAIDADVRTHNLPPEQIQESTTITFTTPASWWQHWKRDVAAKTWALHWITKLWPIALTTEARTVTLEVDLKRFRMYPDAPNLGNLTGFEVAVPGHEITARWQ